MKYHVIQNEKFNKIHSSHSIGFILRTLSAKLNVTGAEHQFHIQTHRANYSVALCVELCTAWRCADLTLLILYEFIIPHDKILNRDWSMYIACSIRDSQWIFLCHALLLFSDRSLNHIVHG